MKTTLKNLIAERDALNAKIAAAKKATIKAGDVVYLKKLRGDDTGIDWDGIYTHHENEYGDEVAPIEFKVVRVKGGKVTLEEIEKYGGIVFTDYGNTIPEFTKN